MQTVEKQERWLQYMGSIPSKRRNTTSLHSSIITDMRTVT